MATKPKEKAASKLTREAFLDPERRVMPVKEFDIPDFGTVIVGRMNTRDNEALEEELRATAKDGANAKAGKDAKPGSVSWVDFRAKFIRTCLRNPANPQAKLLQPEDLAEIGKLPREIVAALYAACLEMNTVVQPQVDALADDLKNDPSAAG